MEFWQHIYSNFDPVAINIFGLKIHWYGLMYISALLSALYIAQCVKFHHVVPVPQKIYLEKHQVKS